MELTPEILKDEVEFRTAFRGYEREQVDAFLERVTAAVSQLQERVAKAEQEAERAEASSGSAAATESATVEAAHRTLLMAQRTADEAVREAREEADRLLAEARTDASLLEGDATRRSDQAQAEAKRVTELAEADARRVTEEAAATAARITEEATTAAEELRHRTEVEVEAIADEAREMLNAEIDVLTHDRAAVRKDLEALDRHLVGQRQAILATLAELTQVLEDPTRLRVGLPEGLSGDVGAETPSSVVADQTAVSADVEVLDLDQMSERAPDSDAVDLREDLSRHDDVHASGEADVLGPDGHAVVDEASVDDARWEFDDDLAGDGGEHPDFWRTASEQTAGSELPADVAAREEGAFLADIPQAVTDGEAEAVTAGESSEVVSTASDDGDLSGRPRKGFGRRR